MVDLAPAFAPDRIAPADPVEIRRALMAWRRCPQQRGCQGLTLPEHMVFLAIPAPWPS